MSKIREYKQDGTTTYCYYSRHTYEDPLSAVTEDEIDSSPVGVACPVQLKVNYPPILVKGKSIQISMTAVISDKDKPADFEFYTGGVIARAKVPERLITNSNNGSSSDGDLKDKTFDIPVANFAVCDFRGCDAFTDSSKMQGGNFFSSMNNPQNFADGTAKFASNEIILSRDGKYTGIGAITMMYATSRLDFISYFPVQVGELPGAVDKINADSTTTYCWVFSNDELPTDAVEDQTYLSIHTNTLCPGTMSVSLSSSKLLIGEEMTVDFGLQIETGRDPSTLVGEVSTVNAVLNPKTNVWSVVPVAVFGACPQNVAEKDDKTCSTYAGVKSRTKDITVFSDRNLTNGAAKYSTKYSFDQPGKYLLVSRVAMQSVDGKRLDMGIYSTVEVSIPPAKSGSMFLYIGLGIGFLILVVGLVFCIMRKRRSRRQMKDIPFRTPMPPASVVQDRSSQYTATSSNFVTHRSPQMHMMPVAYPQYDNNHNYNHHHNNPSSFYPAEDQYGYHNHQQPYKHKDSFTLDPYGRTSFNDISEGESIDMTIRPSDASKFSFQTGYDDQGDWEYDTQSFRTEGGQSEYSDAQRGTFHLNTGGAMAIMEEDDDRAHQHPHHRQFEPSSVASSSASSEWTVRG